jgi:hypothetical protein
MATFRFNHSHLNSELDFVWHLKPRFRSNHSHVLVNQKIGVELISNKLVRGAG